MDHTKITRKVVIPNVTVKVFNDCWQFELVYVILEDKQPTQSENKTKEEDEGKAGSLLLEFMNREGKLRYCAFPLIVTTPPAKYSEVRPRKGCTLSLPHTACNIRVRSTEIITATTGKAATKGVVENHKKIQHLTLSKPLMEHARLIPLSVTKYTAGSSSHLPAVIAKGNVVGIYDDAVLMDNVVLSDDDDDDNDDDDGEDDDRLDNSASLVGKHNDNNKYTTYLKSKDFFILGKSLKEKKIMFECKFSSKMAPHTTQKTITIHFDIAFVYNPTLEYDSLLDLRINTHNLVDGRGFYLPKSSLKEFSNTGKNLLMSTITDGNQKLREQYTKSWFIDHTLSLSSSSINDDTNIILLLGDVVGRLETSIVLKPNDNLPSEYLALNKEKSSIILVPGYNLSPVYRKLVKKIQLSSPNEQRDCNTGTSLESGSSNPYIKRSYSMVTMDKAQPASMVTTIDRSDNLFSATTSSAPNPTLLSTTPLDSDRHQQQQQQSDDAQGEGDDVGVPVEEQQQQQQQKVAEAPLYGTALKAKHHILSKVQNMPYLLGELVVQGKDLKLCGWRFPSENLTREFQKNRDYDTCDVFNAILWKGNKIFGKVKSGPLTTFDRFNTKIKTTEYPQRRADADGNDDEDEEENYHRPYYYSSYRRDEDVTINSFNSGMVLHQNTRHFFLPSPEKIKITRKLEKFSSNTKGDDLSVITGIYQVNVKHNDLKMSKDSEVNNSKKVTLDPYLLFLVVHNATEVTVRRLGKKKTLKANNNIDAYDNEDDERIFQPFGYFLRKSKQESRIELNQKFTSQYPALPDYKKEMEKFFLDTAYDMFNYTDNNNPAENSFADFVVCSIPIYTNDEVLSLTVSLEKILNTTDTRRHEYKY